MSPFPLESANVFWSLNELLTPLSKRFETNITTSLRLNPSTIDGFNLCKCLSLSSRRDLKCGSGNVHELDGIVDEDIAENEFDKNGPEAK